MAFTADVILRVHVAVVSSAQHEEVRETYQELALHAGGEKLARFVSFAAGFAVFGACVGCVRVVKDMAPTLLTLVYLRGDEPIESLPVSEQQALVTRTVWIIFMAVVLPLGFFKKISVLRYSSYLGFTFCLYLVVAVAYRSVVGVAPESLVATPGLEPLVIHESLFSKLSVAIGIYNFTYMLHLNVIPLSPQVLASERQQQRDQRNIVEAARARMSRLVYAAVAICTVLYAVFGLCAASIYGPLTQGNILLNLAHDPIMAVPRVMILLTILFSFPLLFHPLRCLVLEMQWCCGAQPTLLTQFIVSVLLMVLQLLVATRVPGIQVVFSFVGSSILLVLSYAMPTLFYLRLVRWRKIRSGRLRMYALTVLLVVCRRSPVGAAAALAVTRLAEHNTALLVEHGAVALLVELLATGDRQHKERAPEALSALVTLSDDPDITDAVVAAGAIKPLVELVRSGVGEQRASAASVLAVLAGCGSGYDTAVGDAGAAQPLVDIARDGVGQEKCRAIFAIYAVGAGHDANWCRLAAAGVDVVLVDVLRSTTLTHRSCAAHALAGLAHGNRTIQSAFGKAGVFEPLVEFLRSRTDEVKEAAATAIADLVAKHDTNKAAAVEAGVVLLLLVVMRDGPCEATAKKALGSLAQKSALSKLRIVQAGALSPLVDMLREGDNDAKREAANALRCIAKNNESYAVEMALLGALEALVANLSASSARGDEQGAWAVLRALRWLTECRTNQDALLALGVRDVLNDAEAPGSRSLTLVARVRDNLNLRGEKSTDDETCRIM